MSKPSIVVFDLGKVLVDFDYSIAIPRIAAHGTLSVAGIKSFFFGSHLLVDYECGRVTRREFFEQARRVTGFRGTLEEFGEFFADIFTAIPPMIELYAGLYRRGALRDSGRFSTLRACPRRPRRHSPRVT